MVHPSFRKGKIRGALVLAVALAGFFHPASASMEFGKVTLKSGEVIKGDVVKNLGDGYILRTPDGLRSVAKDLVEAITPASAVEPDTSTPKNAKESPKQEAAPKSPSPPPAGPPSKVEPAAKASSKPDQPKAVGPEPVPEAPAKVEIPVIVVADKRIEDARSGGPPPVLEITLGGKIDGKPLNPFDPVTMPRLSFFFTQESLPRFELLVPPALRPEKSKSSPLKATGRGQTAEYIAKLTTDTGMMEITFYGTSLQKKFHSQVTFELFRASDKKLIVRLGAVEDEDGEPENREKLCRAAYDRAVKTLLERLKALKTFGGSSSGSDANGTAPTASGR